MASSDLLHHHLSLTIHLLESLGIAVNFKKSCLQPVRRLQYIGAVLDSSRAIAFLPRDRASTIIALAHLLQHEPCTTTLNIQSLLGLMAASITVIPLACLRMRPLQLWFLQNFKALTDLQSIKLTILKKPLCSLAWWISLANLLGGTPFIPPIPSVTLTTDASMWGWEVHIGKDCIGGQETYQLPGTLGHPVGPHVLLFLLLWLYGSSSLQ